MPLKKGYSQTVVNQNTKELIKAGYKPNQASAIAHENARRNKRKSATSARKRNGKAIQNTR